MSFQNWTTLVHALMHFLKFRFNIHYPTLLAYFKKLSHLFRFSSQVSNELLMHLLNTLTAQLVILQVITLMFGEEWKLGSSLLRSFVRLPLTLLHRVSVCCTELSVFLLYLRRDIKSFPIESNRKRWRETVLEHRFYIYIYIYIYIYC